MVANIMKIIYYAERHRELHGKFDWETYTQFDPDFLEENFAQRMNLEQLFMASGLLNAIGWMTLAYPIIQMSWVLSKQGTRNVALNVAISMFVIAGGLTELMTNFFWMGMNTTFKKLVEITEWRTSWIRVDVENGMGWGVLEINHIIGRGFVLYTDNFEWLCLAATFIFTFVSVRGWLAEDRTSFGFRWNALGLFIGLLCILEFAAEILRFEELIHGSSKTFAIISIVYAIMNRIIFIPAWIVALGFMLPRATMKATFESKGASNRAVQSELQLAELQPDQGKHHDDFSIEDVEEETPATVKTPPLDVFGE
jgi:hypothetical protein